jgi:hypothetical protein
MTNVQIKKQKMIVQLGSFQKMNVTQREQMRKGTNVREEIPSTVWIPAIRRVVV